MTDEVNGGIIVDDMPQLGDEIRGRRRHRWGPVPSASLKPTQANGDAATDSAPQVAPKKRRRSRWDTGPEQGSGDGGETKGNSQALMLIPDEIVLSNGIKIIMPPAITGRHVSGDPEVVAMHKELADIERMLRGGTLQLPPEHERSPSPPPVYDSNGIRLNTREIRFKEKITRRRNALIEQLLKRDPAFKPPADYKPEKKWRKLYIPYKEYPEYNFIGLIIGPRGNTHKRMQQESNTVIAIRGKGSSKEGAAKSGGGGAGYNDGDDDDLHVLITGDRDEDVDAAAAMVERLLQPLDEEMNEHKQKQLRELALINGTLKEENYCYLCGETGHRQVDCPKKSIDVYRLPDAVQAKVEEQYARDIARLNPGEGGNADEEYRSFLAELGGSDPRAAQPRGGPRESRESPDVKLWVGNLPPTLTSPDLRALFEPYGTVTYAEVKMDGPVSRGYGFVHYADSQMAKTAFEAMAGRMVDGRALNVRRKLEDSQGRRGLGANHVPLNSRPDDNIPPECKIYVGHIPMQVDEFILKREFEKFGTVVSAKLIIDRETGRPKGYGFVSMADGPSAAAAIASLNGYQGFDFQSRPIVVRQAGPPSNDHRGGRPPSGPPLPPGAPPAHHGGLPPPPPPYPGAYPPHPGAQHYQHMDPYAAAYQYGADPYGYAVHGGMPGAPGMPGMAGMGTDPYAAQYYDPNAYEAYGAAPAVDSTAEVQQYQHLPPPPPPPPPEGMLEEAIPPPPPPPLPEGDALPDQAPPPPPPPSLPTTESQNQQMSEYERFMAEMQAQIP